MGGLSSVASAKEDGIQPLDRARGPEPFRQAQGPEHVEGLVEGLDCFVALLASTLLASRVAMTIKNQTDPLPLLDLRAQK
jgi:hypothetical protein